MILGNNKRTRRWKILTRARTHYESRNFRRRTIGSHDCLGGLSIRYSFYFLDPSVGACATTLGGHLHGDYHDENLLAELAERADAVTYEFENVPANVAGFLTSRTQVYPSPKALAVAQDRLVEKEFLNNLGIPTAPYATVDSLNDLQAAMEKVGYPAILKTRTQGYDGKGQSVLKSAADLKLAWEN